MRQPSTRLLLPITALLVSGCGSSPQVGPTPTPSPTPSGLASVVIGARTGDTQITLVDATPLPGATLTGCGAAAAGCARRITVSLEILSPAGGTVIETILFLHNSSMRACLVGRVRGFDLAPGTKRRLDLVLDQGDDCGTPTDIRTAAAVIEGPGGIAARQEWGLVYTLDR